jgi:hypothetical protein
MPREFDLDGLLARMRQLRQEPAPPDPGIKPGGIRVRVLRALRERGPMPEDPEKTRQSQEYWARVRREREALAEARRNGFPDPQREPSIWFACNDSGEAVTIGALPEEYSKLAIELRASGALVGEFYTREEALAAARAALADSKDKRAAE